MSDYLQAGSVRLGWALIHFLWQGAVIAAALEIALMFAPRKQASLRYFLCGVALAAMPICLVATYGVLGGETPSGAPGVESHETGSPAAIPAPPTGQVSAPAVGAIADFTSRETSLLVLNRCMRWIVAGWLTGVVVLAARKAGGFLVLWRLRRRGVSAPGETMSELFRQACGKIGVDPRRVCLKVSSLVQVPLTMGWVRPVVLFPAALLSGLSTGEIELLLAHELAHIRRCDYLVNLVQTVVETLFFYHPVTWWISRRMRQERENACDDLVATCSTEALAYAKVLLRLESIRPPGASLAPSATGGSLLQRIQRLTGDPASNSGMGLPVLLILVSILGVIAVVSLAEAQPAPPSSAASTPVAKSVPPAPEPVFAQPVTMKETKNNGAGVTRLYYQGGNLILQQCLGASPGSMGQLVFYKGAVVVDDRRGTQPVPFSSRFVEPSNSKIEVQSIAADSISPASLRILDPDHQIISEFIIDKDGLMKPITQAGHDADIERRKAAFSKLAPANPGASTDDSFIAGTDDDSARATLQKLKSIVIDKVNFTKADIAEVLEFITLKSKDLDPDKKGIGFVLGDLSHLTPADQVHREITVVLENVPLDALLGYICQQTNLKCSIADNTVYFKPPRATSSTAAPSPNSQGAVSITKATYEAKDGTGVPVDVTGLVTKMLNDNSLNVLVGNDVFGGDPAWLHVKELRVEYTVDGKQLQAAADEGTMLTIPPPGNAPIGAQNRVVPGSTNLAPNFGQLFGQVGKMMASQANVMAQQITAVSFPNPTNAPGGASPEAATQQEDDPFALPATGTFGQLGRVMEIHIISSRQLIPGVRAVHYYSQYRGLPAGAEAGVTWGGEIAVYGLPSSMADGDSWKGLVYPAGHITFGPDRFSVYATTKEQAIALAQNESEQDRKSFPP